MFCSAVICVSVSKGDPTQGSTLEWFKSYLSVRSIFSGGWKFLFLLSSFKLWCASGFYFGLLFSLYLLPLGCIFQKYNNPYHFYADDTQGYFPLNSKDNCKILSLLNYLTEVRSWLAANFVTLNDSKSETVVFGPPASITLINNQIGSLSANSHAHVKNLGMIFDNGLKFDKQISAVVKNSFYHLRSISNLKTFLSVKDLETVILAFITSRLDYCNSL